MENTKNTNADAIQFYAELKEFEPKLWRRFLVYSDAKMSTLAYALISMFNAKGYHLFRFETTFTEFLQEFIARNAEKKSSGKVDSDENYFDRFDELERNAPSKEIEFLDPDDTYNTNYRKTDPRKLTVGEVFSNPEIKCIFTYDFGDNWKFDLKVEEVKTGSSGLSTRNPVFILDGENYGIIEYCGGIPRLESLIEAFKSKKGEEYEDLKEWLGVDDFDFSHFDLAELNLKLKDDIKDFKSGYEAGKK